MQKLFFLLLFINLLNSGFSQGKIENTNQNNAPAIPSTVTNSVNSGNTYYLDTIQIIPIESDKDVKSMQLEEKKSQPKSNSSVKNKSRAKSDNDAFFESEKKEETSGLESSTAVAAQQFSLIYLKTRMQDTRRSPTIEQQAQLDKTVENLKNINQSSFDYHLKKFIAGNYNLDLKDHLTNAYIQNSTNSEVLNQMVAVSIIESDTSNTNFLLNQLIDNKILDQSYIDYGNDILVSAPTNSTLITHSFNDSYGVLFNQFSNSIRPDVTIIDLDFCQSTHYRKQLEKKGYKIPANTVVDTAFFFDFLKLNSSKPIAISLTLPKNYFQNAPIDLYTNGLVFTNIYDSESNVDLYENKMNKKVMAQNSGTSKKLALNYLPVLFDIRKKYSELKQTEKVREVDKLIDSIAKSSKKENQINNMKNKN